MPTITQLYPTFAAVLGLEEETVRQHARFLREAGYLPASVGKRLAYAAPRHVASLLAAILVDPRVVKAGRAGEIAHSLRVKSYECNDDPVAPPPPAAIVGLPPDHSFVDGLEALITGAIQYGDLLGPSGLPLTPIWASVARPWVSAEISMRDDPYTLRISYGPPAPADMTDAVAAAAEMTSRYGGGDLHTERRIGETTIYGLAEALCEAGE